MAWSIAAATMRIGRWSSSARAARGSPGYAPEDLLLNGRLSYEELTHPDDRQRVREAIDAAVAEDRRFHVEYRIQHADGSVRWVWERGVGIRDATAASLAIEGIIEDITRTRGVRAGAARGRAALSQPVRQRDRGHLPHDARRPLPGRQSRARAHLRFRLAAGARRLAARHQEPALRGCRRAARSSCSIIKARGEISGFESRVYRKNGDTIWISENARAVFDDEGRVLHYEGTVEDITERASTRRASSSRPTTIRSPGSPTARC